MRRPPVILWLYILGELWRLILLTSAILVTVLAFAAAVRFLADGRLGPIETIRLMFLAMPPMLQYALPFAAGFGATLAYHRICCDNEMTAGHAAGVSHRTILVPAFLSGLVLSCVVLVLSNMVIPRFLRSMEELVTRDAARYIVSAIERREAVEMENMLLYADLVRRNPQPAGSADQQLYLKGVFVVELDPKGGVKGQASAEDADVWLLRVSAGAGPDGAASSEMVTHVIVRSRGLVGQKAGQAATRQGACNFAKTIPNAFKDDPKFLSWSELEALRHAPGGIGFIDSRRRVLAAHLAERETTNAIDTALRESGTVRFEVSDDTYVVLHASAIAWDAQTKWWFVQPGLDASGKPAPLLVERRLDTQRVVRQQAESAKFRTNVDPDSPTREVTVTLSLGGLSEASGPDRGAAPGGAQVKSQVIGDLAVASATERVASLMGADPANLIKDADAHLLTTPGDDYVKGPRNDLDRRVKDLMREITSKQHERFASAAACLVMVMTGAVMAIKLRSKLPLAVYLWAFFPALATVITISAGQQMIHNNGLLGIPIMWGGVVGLALFTFVQYRKVARN